MKSPSIRLSALVVALPLFATAAVAQDAIVPDDFGTISSAVAGAVDQNGDGVIEILVRAGSYVENVDINRSDISLSGEGAGATVLQGAGNDDALEVNNANDVTVSAMTVVGVAGVGNDAIDFDNSDRCAILDVVTEGGDTGIDISDSQDCEIRRSEVSGATTEGVDIDRSSRLLMVNNTSRDNGQQGFSVDDSDNVRAGRNTATGNGDSGFRDRFSSGNSYGENVSTDNVDNGFRVEGSNNTFLLRNTASDNRSNGLRMEETTGSDVYDNAFTGNNEWGIRLEDNVSADFDRAQGGNQAAPGDNDVSGNGNGGVRND